MMQTVYWKNPKTAWRYVRLPEVLAPDPGGEGMVTGSIGGPVPIIQRVSAQRPEQLVDSLRKPNLIVAKTIYDNPSANGMGWTKPRYALGKKGSRPRPTTVGGQRSKGGWNHQSQGVVRPFGARSYIVTP